MRTLRGIQILEFIRDLHQPQLNITYIYKQVLTKGVDQSYSRRSTGLAIIAEAGKQHHIQIISDVHGLHKLCKTKSLRWTTISQAIIPAVDNSTNPKSSSLFLFSSSSFSFLFFLIFFSFFQYFCPFLLILPFFHTFLSKFSKNLPFFY